MNKTSRNAPYRTWDNNRREEIRGNQRYANRDESNGTQRYSNSDRPNERRFGEYDEYYGREDDRSEYENERSFRESPDNRYQGMQNRGYYDSERDDRRNYGNGPGRYEDNDYNQRYGSGSQYEPNSWRNQQGYSSMDSWGGEFEGREGYGTYSGNQGNGRSQWDFQNGGRSPYYEHYRDNRDSDRQMNTPSRSGRYGSSRRFSRSRRRNG